MPEAAQRLRDVLDDYANFLRGKELALPKHQPHLVRWVRDFLFFARQHGGYTFEQTLDLFLDEKKGSGLFVWEFDAQRDLTPFFSQGLQQASNFFRRVVVQ